MPAPTKTLSRDLLTPQGVGAGAHVTGTPIDVSGVHSLGLTMWLGRANGTAHVSPWARITIEGCPSATDDSMFAPIATLLMPAGSSVASTTTNGPVSAGATSFVVTSATNIAAGAFLWVGDSNTANWEVVRVVGVASNTVTIEGAFMYSHETARGVQSQAEIVTIPSLDITGLARVRARCSNYSGQGVNARALGVTTVL
jgi:hypothetical protein